MNAFSTNCLNCSGSSAFSTAIFNEGLYPSRFALVPYSTTRAMKGTLWNPKIFAFGPRTSWAKKKKPVLLTIVPTKVFEDRCGLTSSRFCLIKNPGKQKSTTSASGMTSCGFDDIFSIFPSNCLPLMSVTTMLWPHFSGWFVKRLTEKSSCDERKPMQTWPKDPPPQIVILFIGLAP